VDERGRGSIEAWHQVFGFGICSHPIPSKLVDHMQGGQKSTYMKRIRIGEKEKKQKAQQALDDQIIRDYDEFPSWR
jgi:hypothetical protein